MDLLHTDFTHIYINRALCVQTAECEALAQASRIWLRTLYQYKRASELLVGNGWLLSSTNTPPLPLSHCFLSHRARAMSWLMLKVIKGNHNFVNKASVAHSPQSPESTKSIASSSSSSAMWTPIHEGSQAQGLAKVFAAVGRMCSMVKAHGSTNQPLWSPSHIIMIII